VAFVYLERSNIFLKEVQTMWARVHIYLMTEWSFLLKRMKWYEITS